MQGLFTFRQSIAGLQGTDLYLGRIKFLHVERPTQRYNVIDMKTQDHNNMITVSKKTLVTERGSDHIKYARYVPENICGSYFLKPILSPSATFQPLPKHLTVELNVPTNLQLK